MTASQRLGWTAAAGPDGVSQSALISLALA